MNFTTNRLFGFDKFAVLGVLYVRTNTYSTHSSFETQHKILEVFTIMKKTILVLMLAVSAMFLFVACNPTGAASGSNASGGNAFVSGGNILPNVSAGNAN